MTGDEGSVLTHHQTGLERVGPLLDGELIGGQSVLGALGSRWEMTIGLGVALVLGAVYLVMAGSSGAVGDIEYRYAPVVRDVLAHVR
jgi:hypothetical protein